MQRVFGLLIALLIKLDSKGPVFYKQERVGMDGRLFLFYKGFWGNARKDWDKDEPTQTAKADAQWKKISGE